MIAQRNTIAVKGTQSAMRRIGDASCLCDRMSDVPVLTTAGQHWDLCCFGMLTKKQRRRARRLQSHSIFQPCENSGPQVFENEPSEPQHHERTHPKYNKGYIGTYLVCSFLQLANAYNITERLMRRRCLLTDV